MNKQFKQRGYNHKSILRPRPELKYISRKIDYKKLLSGKKINVKQQVFENLDNASNNESLIIFGTNKEIADDMRSCTGEFINLPDDVFCQYIQDWKDINIKN